MNDSNEHGERVARSVAQSIHHRLVNYARAAHREAQTTFVRYGQERLLYRLGQSRHRERFVLKGALLFSLWANDLHRPTMDVDFLAYGQSAVDSVVDAFREVCIEPVEEDGLVFPPESVRGEAIREEAEYQGVRLRLVARLGSARIPLQVDMGFGDAVEPAPQWAEYPSLLGAPPPVLRVYPKEAVVAEKFHVMATRGLLNSRLKDYYDLYTLAGHSTFEGAVLARAMAATFRARRTPIPDGVLPSLGSPFADDPVKQRAWSAFLAKNRPDAGAASLADVVATLAGFVTPAAAWAASGEDPRRIWAPGGPWSPSVG